MKRIIASVLAAVSMMTLLATAAFAAVPAEVPVGQTSPCTGGPRVITPDFFDNNFAYDLDYGKKSYIQAFARTWHTYNYEVMQDPESDLMISALTFPKNAVRGNSDLCFYYHSSDISRDGDLYYPTVDVSKAPYFAVKYRMNDVAYEYAKTLNATVNFYSEAPALEGNTSWNLHKYIQKTVTGPDEWAIDIVDLSQVVVEDIADFPASMIADLYFFEWRPFGFSQEGKDGLSDEIPEGAQVDFAWMGFFETPEDAKAYEGLKASDMPTKPVTTEPDTTKPDTTKPADTTDTDTTKPVESGSASDTAPAAAEGGSNIGLYVAIGAVAVVVVAVVIVVVVKKKKK